jgi:hypothetical protein
MLIQRAVEDARKRVLESLLAFFLSLRVGFVALRLSLFVVVEGLDVKATALGSSSARKRAASALS